MTHKCSSVLRTVCIPLLIAVVSAITPSPRAVSVNLVISQVYGGGGNSGAPLTHDFIELYNRGDVAVSVDGWTLQYASATGTGNFGATTTQITELSGTIQPGKYRLVQEAGGAAGVPLPAPDVTDASPIAMSATAGKVALVNGLAPLGCNGGSTPCSSDQLARIIDLVGYGGANFFETAPAPALSNTTAALRAGDGAADTDNNAADFTAGTPNPRNSAFTPAPPPPSGCAVPTTHEISAVQGAGASTPLAGQTVRVEGVVTGSFQAAGGLGGFYIQDDTPDNDPATSEGLFVFRSATPVAAGERVRVTGRAIEFSGLTELSPVSVVDVCGNGTITPVSYQLPRPAGATFEPLENMLVTFPQTLTATEHFQLGRFGEVTVAVDGRLFQPTDRVAPGAAAVAMADLNARRRLLIDDGSNTQNPAAVPFLAPDVLRLGDTTANVTGVLTFGFSQYRLEPTAPIVFTRANPRPAAPAEVGGNVRIASFNALNYFTTLQSSNPDARGANTPAEFARQHAKEVAAILGLDADVIGVMEIENNGSAAIDSLVDGLNAVAGAGTYAFVAEPALNPPNEFGGTFGTDAIKVALIYRPAVVTPAGAAQSSDDPVFNRPPLVQTFELAGGGESFTVAVNHFKSKSCGGAAGLDLDQGDGQSCFNALRLAQATALTTLIGTLGVDNVLIVGDLNAYAEEDPIRTIENAGYTAVAKLNVPPGARYSFVFDGQAGELDHVLVSGDLLDNVAGATIWHINADEPLILDYNTEFNPPPLYQPDAYRSSDHDPLVVGLTVNAAPSVDAGGPYSVAEGGSVLLSATGSDAEGSGLVYDWDLDDNGTFETPGQDVQFSAAGLDAPATRTVSVRVTDAGGLTAVDSATVAVVWTFSGFLPPVDDPPLRNRANAGAAVPVKFSLSGDQGLGILVDGSPSSIPVACEAAASDALEETAADSGGGLRYDAATDTYVFVWKTNKSWAGTCRQLVLTLTDGTTYVAEFQFTK